ncbi:MAG: haloacid dehalogenase type II [Acetobacteraceae bacterium]|nr:haloacid dehalogenase type II [Acetobacteraceae bacterium]
MRLADFRVLTFDCYSTLIDWETGLWAALQGIAEPAGLSREAALTAFAEVENRVEQEAPGMPYSELLALVRRELAARWGMVADEAADRRFGASVPDWPAFRDTAEALRRLERYYRLVILSNVDRKSFAGSLPKLGVTFEAVFTAEDIGSYKPDARNFTYLIERLRERGFGPGEILHTAQSLYHDHVPAQAAGLATCWINRRAGAEGWGATMAPPAGARWDFRFATLREMAAAREGEA